VPAAVDPPPEVRLTPSAVEALRRLPKPQVEAVLSAIVAIGRTPAKPLLPGADGKQYMIIAPVDSNAPAVIYRKLDDEDGFLVTAVVERDTYDAYQRADEESRTDSSTWDKVTRTVGQAMLNTLLNEGTS
jgi:mRNA-degrading endonuclease RelE of RelBE toxin-antitoxin system